MGRLEDYRRFAARCLEIARASEDAQTKAIMLQMAQVWARLAKEGEAETRTHDRHGAAGNDGATDTA